MRRKIIFDRSANQATQKFDGVIEAVHRSPDGSIEYARLYKRRGSTWSDHVLVPREELIQQIAAGKKFTLGERKMFEGSNFKLLTPITVEGSGANKVLVSDTDANATIDLPNAPIF